MKTTFPKKDEVQQKWYLFDAKDEILGRLSTKVAVILMGKNKVEYTPHMDYGDFVCVINAGMIKVTGNKKEQKKYYKHTGYIGHLKEETLGDRLERKPEKVIIDAVKRMLPNNKLRQIRMNKLKVYVGSEHPHEAQKPIEIGNYKL